MASLLVVSKDALNARQVYSVECAWKLLDRKYKTAHYVGQHFLVGKIPTKMGDVTAMENYAKISGTLRTDTSGFDLGEEAKLYDSKLVNGIEMGNSYIIKVLNQMNAVYEIIPQNKY